MTSWTQCREQTGRNGPHHLQISIPISTPCLAISACLYTSVLCTFTGMYIDTASPFLRERATLLTSSLRLCVF